jgi:hypothetical protein
VANTIVQNVTGQAYSAGSVNKAYGSSCTNGSLLVAVVTTETGSVTISSVTDPTNGSWTERAWVSNGASAAGMGGIGIYTRANAATTALTVTATLSASTHGYLKIYEITGQAASPIGATVEEFGIDIAPEAHTATLAKEQANSTVIVGGVYYPGTATADSGFTLGFGPSAQNNSYNWGEHREDAGASGDSVLTAGLGTPDNWALAALEIKTVSTGTSSKFPKLTDSGLLQSPLAR